MVFGKAINRYYLRVRRSASLERISQILDAPVNVKDSPSQIGGGPSIRGGIEFRDLSFIHSGSVGE